MKRIVLLLFVLVGAYAYAQDSRGSIVGQITDPTGAAVAKAAITVTSTDTGAVMHVTSTSDGFYTAPSLMPGGYNVNVNAPGFKNFERTDIKVETQQNVTINVQLEVGAATEQVTVRS